MRIILLIPPTILLTACTDTARMYPIDPVSMQAGIPTIQFVRQGLGRGPVTVTMPDGEILKGEYQLTENASIGFGFSGARSATAIAYGSGRPVVISAVGDRGTIMNCEGAADIGGHGSGLCQTSKGMKYRVMF